MRKSLWIIFALILVAIAAPNVRADSFTDGTLNFTLVGGGPAPTASFVFDNTTSTFTSFTVRWDGAAWDFAGVATSLGAFPSLPTGPTPSAWMACGPSTTSLTCAEPPQDLALFFPGLAVVVLGPLAPGTFLVPDAAAFGGYTVSEVEVATPEPSSVALLLVGIGFLLVISKRLSLS
jgi:hypothetical protein